MNLMNQIFSSSRYRQAAASGQNPAAATPQTGGYRKYGVTSGQLTSGASSTQTLTFSVPFDVYELTLSVDIAGAGAPAALNAPWQPLDMFTLQVYFQTGDQLNTVALQGSALVDRNTGRERFLRPYRVPGGQSLQCKFVNLTNITITNVYASFNGIELAVANANV